MTNALSAGALLVLLVLPGTSGPATDAEDGGWLPPPDARERLERILEDPVFVLEDPEPGPVERIMAKVRGFLLDSFRTIAGALMMNTIVVTALLWVVIGLALLGVASLIVRMTRARPTIPKPVIPARSKNTGEEERNRSPAELLAEAGAAFRAGKGRNVLRLCLTASILALQQKNQLPAGLSMTDFETARVLERTGPVHFRKPFRTLAGFHDRLVYAGQPAGAGELDRALELAGRIVLGEVGPAGSGNDE